MSGLRFLKDSIPLISTFQSGPCLPCLPPAITWTGLCESLFPGTRRVQFTQVLRPLGYLPLRRSLTTLRLGLGFSLVEAEACCDPSEVRQVSYSKYYSHLARQHCSSKPPRQPQAASNRHPGVQRCHGHGVQHLSYCITEGGGSISNHKGEVL